MSEKNISPILSRQTSITTAFAITLCTGAFWIGKTTQSLQSQLDKQAEIQAIEDKNYEKWTNRLEDILEELKIISYNNTRRLDRLDEQTIEP